MLTLNLIVKNGLTAPSNVVRAVQSVLKLIDFAVIVDTGSTDGTPERLRDYFNAMGVAGTIRTFAWTGNFSDARNYAISKSPQGRILWMDADEELPSNQADFLKSVLDAHPESCVGFYTVGEGILRAFPRVRVFPNLPNVRWRGALHEDISEVCHEAGLTNVLCGATIRHWGYGNPQHVADAAERNDGIRELARAIMVVDIENDATLAEEEKATRIEELRNLPAVNEGRSSTLANNILDPLTLKELTPEQSERIRAQEDAAHRAADSWSEADGLPRPETVIIRLHAARAYTSAELQPIIDDLRRRGLDVTLPEPEFGFWSLGTFQEFLRDALGRNYLEMEYAADVTLRPGKDENLDAAVNHALELIDAGVEALAVRNLPPLELLA